MPSTCLSGAILREPQGQIGSSFSHRAAMSDAELSERSMGMC